LVFYNYKYKYMAKILDSALHDYFKGLCCPTITTCFSKTTTTTGTAQSPANGTKLVTMSIVTGAWGTVQSSYSMTGASTDPAATFTSPWLVYAGTPSFIRDDNGGGIGSNDVNIRLDQGDILGATFQGYAGVQYRQNDGIFRKVNNAIAGATSLQLSVKAPSGAITVITTGNSTRAGGGAGWDSLGSNASFTATETGTYTMLWECVSPAPTRMLAQEIQVNNASGEVLSFTSVTTKYTKTTKNGVDVYTDEKGASITGTDLTQLLADIANGTATEVTCTF
jgi:hypothetical protein